MSSKNNIPKLPAHVEENFEMKVEAFLKYLNPLKIVKPRYVSPGKSFHAMQKEKSVAKLML